MLEEKEIHKFADSFLSLNGSFLIKYVFFSSSAAYEDTKRVYKALCESQLSTSGVPVIVFLTVCGVSANQISPAWF